MLGTGSNLLKYMCANNKMVQFFASLGINSISEQFIYYWYLCYYMITITNNLCIVICAWTFAFKRILEHQ